MILTAIIRGLFGAESIAASLFSTWVNWFMPLYKERESISSILQSFEAGEIGNKTISLLKHFSDLTL